MEQSSTALTGAAGGKMQRTGRTALVPGGHRSALTEPAGETAQRIGRGPGAVAPCLPFPPACAKGRRTLSRAGQAGLQKTYAEPPALSGNPRRGFPAKSLPQEAFSTLLRLPKATKAVGRCPTPCKFFEKNLTKNFYLSLLFPSAGFPVSGSQKTPAPLSAVRVMSCAATRRDLRAQALGARSQKGGSL